MASGCQHSEGTRYRGPDDKWNCTECDLERAALLRAAPNTRELRELLLWARANAFRVTGVEMDGVKLAVDDLRIGAVAPSGPEPKSPHDAWAMRMGITPPSDHDVEDDEGDVDQGVRQ